MDKETAKLIVDKIISDLNGRRGCGIDSFDDEIQDEIRNSWIDMTMTTRAVKKEKIKVIKTECYDDDTALVGNPHKYIEDFINGDCEELIEESYGDKLPDGGFDLKLYFLLNKKYYCVDINCKTRWESGFSNRKNFIDSINIKSITDFDINEDKFKIEFI